MVVSQQNLQNQAAVGIWPLGCTLLTPELGGKADHFFFFLNADM